MDGSKNYADIVEFPVEIVSRDGDVRFYSYEESVRLYQRRISMAALRYNSADEASQESRHCQSRINQLRRSYYRTYGWGTPVGAPDPQALLGALVGEVAAFLREALAVPGRLALRLERLEEIGALSRWYVLQERGNSGIFLDIYRLEGDEEDRGRFVDAVVRLQGLPDSGSDSVRLIAYRHVADCGLILSGRAEEAAQFVGHPQVSGDPAPPWLVSSALIYQRRYAEALGLQYELLERQPMFIAARVLGSALALDLDRGDEAVALCQVGLHYHPRHPELSYWMAAALARQGRTREAAGFARIAIEVDPAHEGARLLAAVLALSLGRGFTAWQLAEGPIGSSRPGRKARAAVGRVRRLIGGATLGFGAAAALLIGGASAQEPLHLGAVGLGLVVAAGTAVWVARQVIALNEAAVLISVPAVFRKLDRAARERETAH